jgi:hypothetical protein
MYDLQNNKKNDSCEWQEEDSAAAAAALSVGITISSLATLNKIRQ